MPDIYFHGDVVFKRIDKIPRDVKKKKDNIIAYGELTGHAHTIKKELIENGVELFEKGGTLYISNDLPIEIEHQQHKSLFIDINTGLEIKLPKGNYEISYPLEYNHFDEEAKRVLD